MLLNYSGSIHNYLKTRKTWNFSCIRDTSLWNAIKQNKLDNFSVQNLIIRHSCMIPADIFISSPELKYLDLSGSGVPFNLLISLSKSSLTLEFIDISGLKIEASKLNNFFDLIISKNKQLPLKYLFLKETKLNGRSLKLLVQLITQCPYLQVLDLSASNINLKNVLQHRDLLKHPAIIIDPSLVLPEVFDNDSAFKFNPVNPIILNSKADLLDRVDLDSFASVVFSPSFDISGIHELFLYLKSFPHLQFLDLQCFDKLDGFSTLLPLLPNLKVLKVRLIGLLNASMASEIFQIMINIEEFHLELLSPSKELVHAIKKAREWKLKRLNLSNLKPVLRAEIASLMHLLFPSLLIKI